jgi:hypothetical protein
MSAVAGVVRCLAVVIAVILPVLGLGRGCRASAGRISYNHGID